MKTYREFLEEKHSRFNTPVEIINPLIQKVAHSDIAKREKIIAGEMNEVYSIETTSENELIVRISHDSEPHFEGEKFALDKARKAGVPTPRVLLIDDVQLNGKYLRVCIEEKLPGEQLSILYPNADDVNPKPLIVEAGKILHRIHSVPIDGFGRLNGNGNGQLKTWEEYMLKNEKNENDLLERAGKLGLDPEHIKITFEILRKHKHLYSQIESKLLHGDYSPKHLLVKDKIITGVLDMENSGGGDIARDFAWWEYFHEKHFPLDWVMEGYENSEVETLEFRKRINLCKLQIGITLFYYYDITNNQNGINHTIKRLPLDINKF